MTYLDKNKSSEGLCQSRDLRQHNKLSWQKLMSLGSVHQCRKWSQALLMVGGFLVFSLPLAAQHNAELVVQLIDRVSRIEEENRELRGQVEEARHEVDVLKQQVETMNADIEYRLGNAETAAPQAPEAPSAPSPTQAAAQAVTPALSGPSPAPPLQGEINPLDHHGQIAPPPPDAHPSAQGAPLPLRPQGENAAPSAPVAPQAQVSSNPGEAYEQARSLLEQGEYDAAERALAAFVAANPQDQNAGSAQYWLGVTYFVRGQYDKAASTFAKGYKTYPKSPKAADNLLKLARSLGALNRKADACTTLVQLSSEHPKDLVSEVAKERASLGCT